MSKRGRSRREKKRQKSAPMPAASAGLLRFFQEETPGIKVRPELVIILGAALIIISIIAQIYITA
jgi:preprotein translocase subunit Sec61beta